MRHLSFFLCLALLFSACTKDFFNKDVTIDAPDYDKVLVAHAFGSNLDSIIRLHLTRNFGILETVTNDQYDVPNATVSIYENGQPKLVLAADPLEPSYYEMALPPNFFLTGQQYELRAEHADFQTMSGLQTMPAPVQVDSVVFKYQGGISTDGSELSAFEVYLKDPPGSGQYYAVRVLSTQLQTSYYFDANGNLVIDTIGYYEYAKYPEFIEDLQAKRGVEDDLMISDKTFDGQPYKFVFKAYRESEGQTYRVYVRAITPEYYLYAVTALLKADSEDFPLAEPVTTSTNLTNGLGVFSLSHNQRFEVQ